MNCPGSVGGMASAQDQLSAWNGLHLATTVVRAALGSRLEAEVGLDLSEHEVLYRLVAAPGHRLRMAELTHLLMISKAGTTRVVDRLERRGLVRREQPPNNRRVSYAALTPDGWRTFERSREVFAASMRDHFVEHLSDSDIADLGRITRKLLRGQDAWDEQRHPPAVAVRSDGERST